MFSLTPCTPLLRHRSHPLPHPTLRRLGGGAPWVRANQSNKRCTGFCAVPGGAARDAPWRRCRCARSARQLHRWLRCLVPIKMSPMHARAIPLALRESASVYHSLWEYMAAVAYIWPLFRTLAASNFHFFHVLNPHPRPLLAHLGVKLFF